MTTNRSATDDRDSAAARVSSTRRKWLGVAGLVVLASTGLLAFLGNVAAFSSHESLLAETARNMYRNRPVVLADGTEMNPWLVPNFNGEPRLRKPPLPYWTVAALSRVSGEVNEWSARLPSALAALGTVALVTALVWRRSGQRAALLTGAALATSGFFLIMGRRAMADMPLTFYCTACVAALWMAVETRSRARFAWLIAAGAAAGLAMLAKGPAPLVILPGPALAALVLLFARRGAPQPGVAQSPPTGMTQPGAAVLQGQWRWTLGGLAVAAVVFLAITLPWPIYIYTHVPNALTVWQTESVERAAGRYGHEESPWFYVLRLPYFILPWTFFLVYGLGLAIRGLWRDPPARPWLLVVLAWLIGPLVGFSLAAGKQDHYLLPSIPAAAILIGMAMERSVHPATRSQAAHGFRVLAGHGVAFAFAGIGATIGFRFVSAEAGREAIGLAVILAAGGAVAVIAAVKARPMAGQAALFAAIIAALLWAEPTLVATLDPAGPEAQFGRQVRQLVPRDARLYSLDQPHPTVVYYAKRQIDWLAIEGDPAKRLADRRPFFLICEAQHLAAARQIPGLEPVAHENDSRHPDKVVWLFRTTEAEPEKPGGTPPG